ncbi:TnsA endonuclease N-terminal domain-containing protein [Petrocella sp. FN5]|uniref:TnsA endonuclease N-terminal domain-containing protein n=1 Tax=Petrocella sp. FN5 TaxID=3032002 RepID=UPI0023DA7BC5|nr:TnsA endonuclease N-terminal domain-containing protein [Petrocella sp. FN5]MDF1617309.1 TnsA endonuclease N-terminal domain-containing protein [Petrocella sp. FN5]
MAKRKNEWNNNVLQKRIKEGRGEGFKENYKPWILSEDLSSMGSSYRLLGIKTNRLHHLFSKTMYELLLLAEYADAVIDIRENYPLFDLFEVVPQIEDFNMKNFRDKDSNKLFIQAVSFFLTCRDAQGKEYQVARSVKYASELEKKITMDRMEIFKRYFNEKNIDWKIVTNKQINKVVISNIEYFREGATTISLVDFDDNEIEELIEVLIYRLLNSDDVIELILRNFENDYDINRSESVVILKNIFWNKKILWDMKKPFTLKSKRAGYKKTEELREVDI